MRLEPVDVFIPVRSDPDYQDFLPLCVEGLQRNLSEASLRHLVVVGAKPRASAAALAWRGSGQVLWLQDEDFAEQITEWTGLRWQKHPQLWTPWVRQQIFKLHSFLPFESSQVLVVDADLLYLKPVRLWDEQGRIFFYMENEYFKPYFEVIRDLVGLEKKAEKSFISDQMFFQAAELQALFAEVKTRHQKPFLSVLAELLDQHPKGFQAFSEYELYGTYVLSRKPEMVAGLVTNPLPGLPHFHLPRPKDWSYEELQKSLKTPHCFLPMAPSHRMPPGCPPLEVRSL